MVLLGLEFTYWDTITTFLNKANSITASKNYSTTILIVAYVYMKAM